MKLSPDAKKRLADIIEKRHLKLAPIAKEIGTSYSTLWNFIYGKTENFGKIQNLTDSLGLSLEWIQKGDRTGDPNASFDEIKSSHPGAGEHSYKQEFQATIPLNVGIDLAIRAVVGDRKNIPDKTIDFVRESLHRLATGARNPLTEKEFIDYAKGFLAMTKS